MAQDEHDLQIDYLEFPVIDVAEAKRFYSAVFGWSFTDYGPDYTCFADGRLAGGFVKTENVASGGPLIVIYASNLSGTEQAIVENGGRIARDTYDFPGGKRFHFCDPSGHELAVWSDK
jgi:predicted enzyme related to lactoylglutathione lyase